MSGMTILLLITAVMIDAVKITARVSAAVVRAVHRHYAARRDAAAYDEACITAIRARVGRRHSRVVRDDARTR